MDLVSNPLNYNTGSSIAKVKYLLVFYKIFFIFIVLIKQILFLVGLI